jgi:hypothetical protein
MVVSIPTPNFSGRRPSSGDSENEPERALILDQSANDDNFVTDCPGRENHADIGLDCIAEITNAP